MKSLGYTVTLHGCNSLHVFYCDKCNKKVYDISKFATKCKCEEIHNVGSSRTQTQGNGTEIASNAEGSE